MNVWNADLLGTMSQLLLGDPARLNHLYNRTEEG
jgi:hypothetical protein